MFVVCRVLDVQGGTRQILGVAVVGEMYVQYNKQTQRGDQKQRATSGRGREREVEVVSGREESLNAVSGWEV